MIQNKSSEWFPSPLLSYRGRINRLQFFVSFIISFAVLLGIMVPEAFLPNGSNLILILRALVLLMYFVFLFSLMVRRLRDQQLSAWFILGFFVPIINFLLWAVLLFGRTKEGDRHASPPPYDKPFGNPESVY